MERRGCMNAAHPQRFVGAAMQAQAVHISLETFEEKHVTSLCTR